MGGTGVDKGKLCHSNEERSDKEGLLFATSSVLCKEQLITFGFAQGRALAQKPRVGMTMEGKNCCVILG